jgi:hypothetical protein
MLSRVRGEIGWICRLDRNLGREFDLWLAQRRLKRVRIAGDRLPMAEPTSVK